VTLAGVFLGSMASLSLHSNVHPTEMPPHIRYKKIKKLFCPNALLVTNAHQWIPATKNTTAENVDNKTAINQAFALIPKSRRHMVHDQYQQ